jgi:ferritin
MRNMLAKQLQDALNEQVRMEFSSAYVYLAMSTYFDGEKLPGFSKWMRVQYAEETGHALKLMDYLGDRGARVWLQAIERPNSEFKSVVDVFRRVLEHERKVTASIHHLYDLAGKKSDYPTQVMLQWFVTEQVEEEKSVQDILDRLEMIGDNGASLYMLDHQMGARASK